MLKKSLVWLARIGAASLLCVAAFARRSSARLGPRRTLRSRWSRETRSRAQEPVAAFSTVLSADESNVPEAWVTIVMLLRSISR